MGAYLDLLLDVVAPTKLVRASRRELPGLRKLPPCLRVATATADNSTLNQQTDLTNQTDQTDQCERS
jgi:hypothetical protein